MALNLKQKYQVITAEWEVAELDLETLLSFSEKTLLYFYPKDDTPGCTLENKEFSDFKEDFWKLWITLIWVSKDSIESHWDFIKKHSLQTDLISDPEIILHKELWAYWEKNNYWKIVTWVIRSTFLLNKNWDILESWKWIKATGHAGRVLKKLS